MRKITLSLGLLLGIISTGALSAAPQNRNVPDRICVYEHSNFGGWEHCYAAGENIGDLGNARNKVSSIRVFGNARATVFANKEFEGASLQVNSDIRDLAQMDFPGPAILGTWNDVIESVQIGPVRYEPPRTTTRSDDRIYRDEPYYRDDRYERGRLDSRQNGICVFEDTNYRGRSTCFITGEAIADLSRNGRWSKRISSVRIQGPTRVVLYWDPNFRGNRVTIDRDVPDLRQVRLGSLTWDNQISSLEVNGGRGNAYGRDNRSR